MIEITNITKTFGKLRVLKGISARCDSAECIALIGPNGCGKTTLIKSILGMVVLDSGSINVLGKNIANGWQYRSAIGYMPQIGRYPENMKIGQVIEMLIDIRHMDQHMDDDLISAFALPSMYHKRMGTLSGGTMQKVSAAIAFLFKPKILILDEPTAGLDPLSSEILKEKIIAERQNGKLFIITSHILSELDDMVSRVIYMQDGNILFNDTIELLKTNTGETKLSRAIANYIGKLK